MAVFTLTIDTSRGFNTDLFFSGSLPVSWDGSGLGGTTTGRSYFRIVNDSGVSSDPRYEIATTGTGLDFNGIFGVSGMIASAELYRVGSDANRQEQLAHLTIALGSQTGPQGGVAIPGLLALTPDTLLRGAVRDTNGTQLNIIGAAGNDRMTASGYKDQLFGLGGNDTLDAKAGNDLLNGGAGNDRLFGGSGNDLLYGGLGLDQMTGGPGNDTFVFDTKPASANRDTILDFSHKDDRIALENEFFKGLTEGPLTAAAFRIGTAAMDASDRIIYDKVTGALYYDRDGTGPAPKVHFATLAGSPDDVNRSDFLII
ncbi:calcium-binding protein [Microvirga sp. TS319]|uniref:calcium-binding protein n=1 Tax=Microvirga sp. TS319 TaxID=3241165 RepID=UPI003519DA2D